MGIPMPYEGSTANVPIDQSSRVIGMPTAQEMIVYETWAKNASDSQMYRNVGKDSAIMMIILSGREYGIGPAQALNGGLQIIEGKVELSARMMSALIRRAGHKLKIEEGDDYCKITGTRKDTGEKHEVKYTLEMAQRAGLVKEKGSWKKHQEDMLFNRALSRIARRLFSDVIGIGYIQGEISDSRGVSDDSTIPVESLALESTRFDQLLEQFNPADRPLAVNFISIVSKHFGWTPEWAVSELSKNIEDTKSRFQSFKEKFNEKVVHSISHHSDSSDSPST